MTRRLVGVLEFLAVCAAVAVASAAALAALPVPPASERRAAELLWGLSVHTETRTEAAGAVRTCRRVSRWQERAQLEARRVLVAGVSAYAESGARLGDRWRREALLAGCPRLLAVTIGRAIRSGVGVRVRETTLAGARMTELRVALRSTSLAVLFRADTGAPFAVRVGEARARYAP